MDNTALQLTSATDIVAAHKAADTYEAQSSARDLAIIEDGLPVAVFRNQGAEFCSRWLGGKHIDSKRIGDSVSRYIKLYKGTRRSDEPLVTVNGVALNPRLDLFVYSPTGFEWGYTGKGPAQLALALLSDCLQENQQAIDLCQSFKRLVVARLSYEAWTLTNDEIRRHVLHCAPESQTMSIHSRL